MCDASTVRGDTIKGTLVITYTKTVLVVVKTQTMTIRGVQLFITFMLL